MAATVEIHCFAGSPPTDQGAIGLGTDIVGADTCGYSSANRIAHPIVRGMYSYEKWLAAKVAVAPDNWISLFKIWGDGSVPDGTTLRMGATEVAAAPVSTSSSIAVNDFTFYSVFSKFNWHDIAKTPAEVAVNPWTKYLVFQLYASTAAMSGDWGPVTVYYEYEEA